MMLVHLRAHRFTLKGNFTLPIHLLAYFSGTSEETHADAGEPCKSPQTVT